MSSLEAAIKETVAATVKESLEPLLATLLERLATANALPTKPKDRLITVDQLAEMTNTARITWDIARMEGRGPKYLKIGRSVRYRLADIEEYLVANTGRVGRRGRPPASTAKVVLEVQTTGKVTGRGKRVAKKTTPLNATVEARG